MTDLLRLGLIGCGAIAQAHFERLARIGQARVVAVADPDPQAIERARQEWMRPDESAEVQVFSDHRAMLEAGGLHAALVLTPHAYHSAHILDCLEAGLDVLSEKPLAKSAEQAARLVERARGLDRVLMVSYQFPLLAPYRYARQVVQAGGLGELEYISTDLSMDWAGIGSPWRLDPEVAGGGVLMDSGSHLIDLVLDLSGQMPRHVLGRVEHGGQPVEIFATVGLLFESGLLATVDMAGRGPWQWNVKVLGRQGALLFHEVQDLVHLNAGDFGLPPEKQRAANRLPPPDQRPRETNPDELFVEAVLAGDRGVSNAEHALAVLRVTEAAYRSAREGRVVEV